MVERKTDGSIRHEQYKLKLGRKTITVGINLTDHTASVRFGTREGIFHRKKPGETTSIFSEADRLLQQVANRESYPIELRFDTASTHLKLWLNSKGKQLDLELEETDTRDPYRETATKTYFPQSNTF